jgi:alkylated DNA repair dioxygenase AlkB
VSYTYDENFMSEVDAVAAFNALWNELVWERRDDAPRFEYWTNIFDRDYTYGRGAGVRTYSAKPNHDIVESVSVALEARLGFKYEGCFLNGYDASRNKQDWLGWHEDDDAGINHDRPIAVVTLYGTKNAKTRTIAFREKLGVDAVTGKMSYGPVETVDLANGSLVLMPAGFQASHQHAIPKVPGAWDSRISMTYRSLVENA